MLRLKLPIFWLPDVNRQLIGKVPDAGKDRWQKETRASEDEMAERHHGCNGYELGQALGDGGVQGGLACCSLSGCKELDRTGQLKSDNKNSDHVGGNIMCWGPLRGGVSREDLSLQVRREP